MRHEFTLARLALPAGPLALVTIDNGEGDTKATTFDRHALASLASVLGALEEGGWAALVVTGKPGLLAAGADIDEFQDATADLARAGSRAGHELFGPIRALPFPTLAAVNGACVGGGVELALHCDYRTISTAVRHFACPEVFLGIVPAWGGTQLVPRLVGAETRSTSSRTRCGRTGCSTRARRTSSGSPTRCSSRRSSSKARSRSRAS